MRISKIEIRKFLKDINSVKITTKAKRQLKLKNKYYNLYGNSTWKSILSLVSQVVNKKKKKRKRKHGRTLQIGNVKSLPRKLLKLAFCTWCENYTKVANWEKPKDKEKQWKFKAEIYMNKIKFIYVYTVIPLYYFL